MSEWIKNSLEDFAYINPRESLPKGNIAKKVMMAVLQPFTKTIPSYSIEPYKGGSKFRNGDTLVARITPCLENGKTAFVDILDENEIGFGSTEFIVLREKEKISDSQFLYYLAMSPEFRDIAILSMTGSSGRQRVQTDVVRNHSFLFPPLPEQKAIAAVLSSLDDKIYLLQRQNQTLKALAQTLFRQWFIEEAQDEWEETALDEIANYLNGLACQKYPPKNDVDKLPVLKIRELRGGISDKTDWATTEVPPKYIINNGDIIFSWSGSLMVKIWDGGKCVLNQHLFKVTSDQFPKWFYYLWTLHHLQKFISIAESKATTMGHIKRRDISNSMVLIPTQSELDKMGQVGSPLIDKIILNNQQTTKLVALRDTLLPSLMNGNVKLKYDNNLSS